MVEDIRRRRFIKKVSHVAVATGIAGWLLPAGISWAGGAAQGDDRNRPAIIAELAYQLLPVQERGAAVYVAVAQQLMHRASQSAAVAQLIDSGIESLEGQKELPWLQLTEEQRRASITANYRTPFVGMVRWTANEVVLRDQQVWQQVGYQGSAIEYGGYLQRGFDDIDWLPNRPGVVQP